MFAKPCSICSGPPEVREVVEQLLSERVPMLEIAQKVGIVSKSAIGRHSKKCLQADRLKRIRGMHSGRLVTVMDGKYLVANAKKLCGHDIISENDLQPDDVLLVVEYSDCEVRNPSALNSTVKISGRKTSPQPLEETQTVEPPPSPVQSETIAQPPQQCHIPPPQSSPEPPATQTCNHRMFRVSGDVWRCQDCGYQPPPTGPTNFTRIPYNHLTNRRGRL